MSNLVLSKHKSLNPINDENTVNRMLAILVEVPNERQNDMWIRHADCGNVCLFVHDAFPGKVLEYVQGTQDDSVTTLYETHPMFESRANLIEVRSGTIRDIGSALLALPSTVVVMDNGRGRDLFLRELGTAQLIDVLALITYTDLATA